MGSIARLLVDLAGDQELLARFRDDPAAVMSQPPYELTPGQQEIVTGGDLWRIREALDYEYAAEASQGALPGYGTSGEGVAMIIVWGPWGVGGGARPVWGTNG